MPKSLSTKLDTYILLLIVALEAIFWGKQSSRWKRASLLFSGTVFLSIAAYSIMNFYTGSLQIVFPRKFANPMLSQMGVVTLCGAIFLCDSAAFFIGKAFGQHHFSSISPHKTIEGAIAGFVTALVISIVGWYFFADVTHFPVYYGIIMGVTIGIFAQLGDLTVSIIKRYFHVKDASQIIPGHGGILDRFGNVFFVAPLLNLYFAILTRIHG
jgi:phosphatidate cytidylyltransferase